MPFTESVKVMLYAKSGNRCAYPGCPISLVFTLKPQGAVVNHGKAAHIVAESRKGPRGRSKMSLAERNSYANGIVFCTNHHNDVVDKFPKQFTAPQLFRWKREHEKRYGPANPISLAKARVLETYAGFVDKWADLSFLAGWQFWTAPMLRVGAHFMGMPAYHSYIGLCSWLATRVWPKKLPALENAFGNFNRVASDLIFVFDKHAYAHGNILRTDRFYAVYVGKFIGQQPEAVERYEFHTALLADLTLELTRAANLICDRVRASVDADFRAEEGRLMVESSGWWSEPVTQRHVVEYRARDLQRYPYPGLEKFMKIREQRDAHFGSGVVKNYLEDE
jgi:hypothetical protein